MDRDVARGAIIWVDLVPKNISSDLPEMCSARKETAEQDPVTTWAHLRGTWTTTHGVPAPKRPHVDRPEILRRKGDGALAIPAYRLGEWFYVTVSREDAWACGFNWYVSKSGYVQRNFSNRTEYLHRLVHSLAVYGDMFIGFEMTSTVDHASRNPLENLRRKLRLLTHADQNRNQDRNDRTDAGVVWDESRKRWKARHYLEGKEIHIGRFRNRSVAIAARRSYIEGLTAKAAS